MKKGQYKIQREVRFCNCGCGKTFRCKVNSKQQYILGHNRKGKILIPREVRTCACGCCKTFTCKIHNKKLYIKGHQNKDKLHSSETKEKVVNKNKQRRILRKIRICACGCGQAFKCKINNKQRYLVGHCNRGRKIKSSHRKGITMKEEYGEERAKAVQNQISKTVRIAVTKRIKENNDIRFPNYNKKACEFFKSFDKENDTQGRYAFYGSGEYFIKELGYWPDYINFDLRLIMEYDEKHHFNEDGKLREKDIQRQKEIQNHFPEFEFKRVGNRI